MNSGPLLEIEHLTVAYDTDEGSLAAVRDVSFDVARGESLGLVGESGSGKSTVAGAILDLLGPGATVQHGTIRFEGQDLSVLSPQARRGLLGKRIGTVFQDPFTSLNPSLRIGWQIAESLIFHSGYHRREAAERARELLAEMGIPRPDDVASAYPHQLSGGMKQRALIAAALACQPSLLILDEPTTALDVTIEAQILDLLMELRRRHDLSLLFISHNLAVVRRLCDSVCVLYAGEVMEHGPMKALFHDPWHPYTKGLLASLPQISNLDRSRPLASIPGNLPSVVELPAGCVFHPRCPFAIDICRSETPAVHEFDVGRKARCHRLAETAEVSWPSEAGGASGRAATPGEPLIRVNGLSKRFVIGGFWTSLRMRLPSESGFPIVLERRSLTAVDRVTLDISSGEVLGLVGESGCGKSTLGQCLIRLLDPTAGTIEFDGEEITNRSNRDLREFRSKAQIIFQNPDTSLNPRKTVRQIVSRPLQVFGLMPAKQIPARVDELLAMVRLSPIYAQRYPHQLSGGEKQRVGIARALASQPKFIVCDEAVSALDVSVQAAIINLLSDLREQLGLAFLFISHDLSVVAHFADRFAVMYQGAICEIGPTEHILQPPYHPYTQALLSAIPHLAANDDASRIVLPGEVDRHRLGGPQCPFHGRCPVKIGSICETVEPPVIEAAPGHWIACHHDLGLLRNLDSVVPKQTRSVTQ